MVAKPQPRTEAAPLNVQKLTREGNLSMHVADQLEGLITNGSIAVGDKLPTESGLCESFGVSRTVIREAVAHLKSLGLVEARRGIGTTVIRAMPAEAMPAKRIRPTTVQDILHVLELRLNMEPAAAALAAERHDAEDRALIEAKHVAFIAARREQTLARNEDFEFHHAIAKATHNPFFGLFFEQLNLSAIPRSKLVSSEVNTATADVYLQRVEAEHQAIVDAIFARDAEAAYDAMRRHLTRAQETYQQFREKS
ncbi:FadR/GntR family transcriptional regulator [Halomonas binhaiensis]|uniref:FadR family transcriptional regulator n=1 Tax=Halomonas binhaiensis TaxID=2562282 RepID=A0A5C1NF21_9GAMM|nr:FadR/GntR family transcriptional regulator [Halomonas binhaiensis]QEM81816.1 FadR family transcriptional regulator [Halomonas binhaiensis]